MYSLRQTLLSLVTVGFTYCAAYAGDLVAPDIAVCVDQRGGVIGELDGLMTYGGKPFPGNDYSLTQINLYLKPTAGTSYPFAINTAERERFTNDQLFYDNDPLSDAYPYWQGTGLHLPSGIPLGEYTIGYQALAMFGDDASDRGTLTIEVDEACATPKITVGGFGPTNVTGRGGETNLLLAGGSVVVSSVNASPSNSIVESTLGSSVKISTDPITGITTSGAAMDLGGVGGASSMVSSDCSGVMHTGLKYADEASCYFVIMANNYDFIREGMETRLNGTIPTPLAREDRDDEGATPSEPVDPDSPLAGIFTLLNNTSKTFYKMQPHFQKTVLQLGVAYKNTFGKKLIVNSAYRDPAYQKVLFDRAVAKYGSVAMARKHVAPPGRSMHNKGIAIDIDYGGNQLDKAEKEGFFAQFGLWRPMGYEPWHAEPEMTRFLRNGTKSAYSLDYNVTTKNSHAIGNMNERVKILTEKFKTLGMYSRYAQELGLMTTEMIIGRNQLKKREQINKRVKKELEGRGQ